MDDSEKHRRFQELTRKEFLKLVGLGAGAFALNGCGLLPTQKQAPTQPVLRASASGNVQEYTLAAAPLDFELGGRQAKTRGYNEVVPGPEIRVTEGDTLRVKVENRLSEGTTIHWHGLLVPNAMEGVANLTQSPHSLRRRVHL